MTEMAPVGYVGISPKCLLGFNKVIPASWPFRFVTLDSVSFQINEALRIKCMGTVLEKT